MRAGTLGYALSSVAGMERVFGKLLFTVCDTAGHTAPERGHQITDPLTLFHPQARLVIATPPSFPLENQE